MNTGDFLPDAETPLFSIFHFFPFPKHSVRHFLIIFIAETTPSSTCFAFLLSVAETPLPATSIIFFPDAETPLFNTFLPIPKTLQSAISSSFSLPKQLRPALVSPFSFPLLKHHCQQPFIIFFPRC
jgi:hypothetical protein